MLLPIVSRHVYAARRRRPGPEPCGGRRGRAGPGQLTRIVDEDVKSSLLHVGDSAPTAPDTGPTGTLLRPAPEPTTVLRFRVLRHHARGGLGEVFVARDEELTARSP